VTHDATPARDIAARRRVPVRYATEEVVSTAQNREDVLLWRCFEGKRDGFYIDIGAGDPNWDSVTRWFHRAGWRGINIEANPLFAPIYAHWRPRDVNLAVGISRQAGTMRFNQVQANDLGQGWGLSSFDPASVATAAREGFKTVAIEVPTLRLQDVVDLHAAGATVDFLKIDVEGGERDVIESADWSRFRPRVVLLEAVRPATAEPSHEDWEDVLLAHDYAFGIFDGVNAYYVRGEDQVLLSQLNAPVNVNDRWRVATLEDIAGADAGGRGGGG
jgi:FkbM family methyltransferase